ncbi:MAG: glycosyl transferase [Lachnospiraceae bacterium]|nr:glycosyl transferase [Lachnospiraceae bacterium]
MAIPKIIHFCWLSGDPYPDLVQRCIQSWKDKLPDYEIKLWNKDSFDIHYVPWVEQACEVKKWAFAADYIRLYALYNYGGIYLDSDVEVLKPFDDLLDRSYFFGREHTPDRIDASHIVEAATFGAEPRLPLIKKCLDYYEGRNFRISENAVDTTVLPHIMANVFAKENVLKDLLPMDYFSPKNTRTQIVEATANTYSVHHFNGSWYSLAQRKHVDMRIRLCKKFGENLGTILSTIYAVFVNFRYNSFRETFERCKQKTLALFEHKS